MNKCALASPSHRRCAAVTFSGASSHFLVVLCLDTQRVKLLNVSAFVFPRKSGESIRSRNKRQTGVLQKYSFPSLCLLYIPVSQQHQCAISLTGDPSAPQWFLCLWHVRRWICFSYATAASPRIDSMGKEKRKVRASDCTEYRNLVRNSIGVVIAARSAGLCTSRGLHFWLAGRRHTMSPHCRQPREARERICTCDRTIEL